ncbi:MAG: type I restriction enzyme HsdR N-terminal domain-containing protein [Cyclobacteriaceae bacterium]|nr:type I restriction enzyme HsdR N-terminal domain-containing protein [Cyclobacteriaceae bacterium]
MIKLNLPAFEYKLKKADGKVWIFDGIRKKYVVLTPEEWVRQHVVQYMLNEMNYPKSLIGVEISLTYNTMNKRADIVVFDRQGKPWMVVECKAPDLQLSHSAALQVATYNKSLQAPYVVITNGMQVYCFAVQPELNALAELPVFQD